MIRLAGISGEKAIKKFQKLGYQIVRQRGSHVRLRHPNNKQYRPLTIPLHKELKIGLLYQLLRDANINVDKFLEL